MPQQISLSRAPLERQNTSRAARPRQPSTRHQAPSTKHYLIKMLSAETLQSYKLMTPADRLRLSLDLSVAATKALLSSPPNVVDRRLELLRIQNDQRNHAMLVGIARTRIAKS